MPETKSKTLCSPSPGLDDLEEDDINAATNRLVTRPRQQSRSRPRHSHSHHPNNANPSQGQLPAQGHRNAGGLTTKQEVTLKAGDMRMARMQISLSQLRTEMEASSKTLRDLAKMLKVDVDAE
ncbi:hypothetical protein KR074_003864 [Drosophila pseudoananassae]|nr:hypothetical protein KR074_003864 [Drosophila pseudoananassae]